MFSFGKAYPEEEYSALDTTTGKHSDAAHAACDLGDLETRRQVTVESSEDLEVVAAVAGSAALAAAVVGAPPHRAALAVEIALREQALISPQFATYVLVACTATRISLSLGGSPEDASSAVRRAVMQAGADQRRGSATQVYDISDDDDASGNHDSDVEYCPEITGRPTDTPDSNTCQASTSKASGAARLISDGNVENPAANTCSDVDHNDLTRVLWNDASAESSFLTLLREDRNEHIDLEEHLCRYLAPPTEMSATDVTRGLSLWPNGRSDFMPIANLQHLDLVATDMQAAADAMNTSTHYGLHSGATLLEGNNARPMTSDPLTHTPPVSSRSQRQELVDVTFRGCQHGLKFGLNFDPSTGTVVSVKPDSQSDLAGVKPDWAMIKINGESYTSHKLRECASRRDNFVITFLPAPEPQVRLKNFADLQLIAADTRVRPDLPTTPDRFANDGRNSRFAGRPAESQTPAPKSPSRCKATTAYASGDGDSAVWAKFLHGVVTQETSNTVASNADSTRDLNDVRPTCTGDASSVAELHRIFSVQTTSEFNLEMLLTALPHITGNEVERDPVPLFLMHEFGSCITQRSRGVAVETLCIQLKHAFARLGCNITCEVAEHLIRGKCDLFEAYIAMRQCNSRWNQGWSSRQLQTPEQIYHL